MSNQTKTLSGQLWDMESKAFISDIMVTISLVQPKNPNGYPEYKVVKATVPGYKPDLSNKSFILKLSEAVSGEAFITIVGIPDMTETQFTLHLQGSAWNNLEWFQLL